MVVSLSWPIPSLITDKGMPFALAADAQLWRATYKVKGMLIPAFFATRLRL